MFGLEKGKSGEEGKGFRFDLEQEWADAEKLEAFKNDVVSKTQAIKALLRGGEKQDDYDTLGTLLLGYAALLTTAAKPVEKK